MTTEHATPGTTVRPGTYQLDPGATTVGFTVRKLGFITVKGTFDLVDGELIVAEDVAHSTVRATVSVDSFTTPSAKRDAAVKSDKLLDAAAHPTITFSS